MSKDNPKIAGKPATAAVRGGPALPKRDLAAPPKAPAKAPPKAAPDNTSGRVKFDDRGNAIWEWSITTGKFDVSVSTSRLKKLENPDLALADDAPHPTYVQPNPTGTVHGYSPYDSGVLAKTEAPRKKDLKRLSDWLALKKQAGDTKSGKR